MCEEPQNLAYVQNAASQQAFDEGYGQAAADEYLIEPLVPKAIPPKSTPPRYYYS